MAASMRQHKFLVFSGTRISNLLNLSRKASTNQVTKTSDSFKSAPHAIYGGLVIERRPVVTAELNEVEKRYQSFRAKDELNRSSYSAHELRHFSDLDLAKRRLQDDYEETEADATLLTAVDMEDAWTDEKNAFKLASRTTEADKTGSKLTNIRKLDQALYLLVKQTFGSDKGFWVFPQAQCSEGFSLRETCERIVDSLAPDLTVQFLGNAPSAYYCKSFSRRFITDSNSNHGAKVFLYKTFLSDGNMTKIQTQHQDKYKDFCWVTSEELQQLVTKDYWKAIKSVVHEY